MNGATGVVPQPCRASPDLVRKPPQTPLIYDVFARLQYHVGMIHRWPYLAVLALLGCAPACNKPVARQPVVVHLFRDLHSPYAHELDHRLLEFQSSNLRLPSGTPVVVETINELDYKAALKSDFEKNVRVEVVILNSPSDVVEVPVLTASLAQASDICAAVKACPVNVPAFVAPDVTGDRAAAAQIFVDYLARQK